MKLTCLSFIIACTLLFSCKKDDAPSPLEGAWNGKLSQGTETPTGSFKMQLGSDHSFKRISGGDITATGNWKLQGTVFTAQYKYTDDGTMVFLTGTFNPDTKQIAGTWKNSHDVNGLWNAQKNTAN